ncbi:hypothetical protein MKEN_00181700 [Mycena kentingensis (nom. inval.)]|nr:hypothetical protein MKEN_00181700 [Mycena kentingensis (nom. inval.)]
MAVPEPSADEQFYHLSDYERGFLKIETGIQDEEALKDHVMAMAKAALEVCRVICLFAAVEDVQVYPYPCIRRLGFIRLKMTRNPEAYEHVLNLGKTVPGAILIELGCCFGNDVRQIARAGLPVREHSCVGSPWRFASGTSAKSSTSTHRPRSKARSSPATSTTPTFSLLPMLAAPPTTPAPALKSLTSLNPLHGHVSAIHTGSFFHLFSEETQLEIARKFAGILSPRAGSMVFGCHGSQPTKGFMRASGTNRIFCHSVESWTEMWEDVFGGKDKVEVKAWMTNSGKVLNPDTDFWMLYWSVKRL